MCCRVASRAVLWGGQSARLSRGANRVVVVLVDGLGAAALRARAGHARTMAPRCRREPSIPVFPDHDGRRAGDAGDRESARPARARRLLACSTPANDRVVNQLIGLGRPSRSRRPGSAAEHSSSRRGTRDLGAVAVGPARYADSGFTRAVLRGAEYRVGRIRGRRFELAARWLREPGPPGLLYLYVPELDIDRARAGMGVGGVDRAPRGGRCRAAGVLSRACAPRDAVLVTADHGMVDVPAHVARADRHCAGALVEGMRFVAGEPRCLQLHFEPDLSRARRGCAWSSRGASPSRRASWVADPGRGDRGGMVRRRGRRGRAADRRPAGGRAQEHRLLRRPHGEPAFAGDGRPARFLVTRRDAGSPAALRGARLRRFLPQRLVRPGRRPVARRTRSRPSSASPGGPCARAAARRCCGPRAAAPSLPEEIGCRHLGSSECPRSGLFRSTGGSRRGGAYCWVASSTVILVEGGLALAAASPQRLEQVSGLVHLGRLVGGGCAWLCVAASRRARASGTSGSPRSKAPLSKRLRVVRSARPGARRAGAG